jgi:hypothetical protein
MEATMTPDEGYALAKFQRSGTKIAMGPNSAVEVPIIPLPWRDLRALHGPGSWIEYYLGFSPSLWETKHVADAACAAGISVVPLEWFREMHAIKIGSGGNDQAERWVESKKEQP